MQWIGSLAVAVGLWGNGPALAARGSVAVLPPYTSTSAAGTGGPVREALRASLEKNGLQVLPDAQVAAEMKYLKLDSARPPSVAELSKLRSSLGVDYVVFPRVLAVGRGAVSQQMQATILVNVAGSSPSTFVHTRQIAQRFPASAAGAPVIPRSAADQAATELLKGFYAKAK